MEGKLTKNSSNEDDPEEGSASKAERDSSPVTYKDAIRLPNISTLKDLHINVDITNVNDGY